MKELAKFDVSTLQMLNRTMAKNASGLALNGMSEEEYKKNLAERRRQFDVSDIIGEKRD